MSTYATAQDVANYIEGWVTDDVFALERLIQRAERDIDRLVKPHTYGSPPTQVISVIGASTGTFGLSWTGATPQTLTESFNVSASRLQSDLQALTNIGSGKVTVLGSNPFTLVWDYGWAESYQNQFVPVLVADPTNLGPSGATVTVVQVEALKLNPLTDVTSNQALALSRATCAQVEYRNSLGEAFFVRPQYNSVKGPDFTVQGRAPFVAPKAQRELAQSGLIFTSTRAVASNRRYGLGRGLPTY